MADPSRRVPDNSHSPTPLFYVDQEFVCTDCGRQEIWTAQQWYCEVAKGSLYATAVRFLRPRPQMAVHISYSF